MDIKRISYGELTHEIAATKRLLNDQYISPPRKRDLTKYLWRLNQEVRRRTSGTRG